MTANLIDEIDRFQRATGITDSAFGLRSVGDAAMVGHMRRNGMQLRPKREAQVRKFIAEQVAKFKREYPD